MIIGIVLALIAAALNLIAGLAVPSESRNYDLSGSPLGPQATYLLAAVAFVAAAALRGFSLTDVARAVLVVAVLLAMAAPLWWGAIIGEFHLSHHVIRLVICAVIVVVFWRCDTQYR